MRAVWVAKIAPWVSGSFKNHPAADFKLEGQQRKVEVGFWMIKVPTVIELWSGFGKLAQLAWDFSLDFLPVA